MSSNYLNYIIEILAPHGEITARSMFGGYSIYKNGVIFALIAYDELYFKVDESNKSQYKKFDSEPFTYEAKGKKTLCPTGRFQSKYWKMKNKLVFG